MKRFYRLLSLVLTLMFCASFCTVSFAKDLAAAGQPIAESLQTTAEPGDTEAGPEEAQPEVPTLQPAEEDPAGEEIAREDASAAEESAQNDTALSQESASGAATYYVDAVAGSDAASGDYYAVFPAYPNGTDCDSCQLFFAVNRTGTKWEFYSKPILKPSNSGNWDDFCIYRSSMLFEGGSIKVWYGAKKQEDSSWHIGMAERNFTEFLSALDS